jgi:predicted RNA-binding Zn ribbon-like protein
VQPGGREPAPPGLELVQAFVNTVDREHGPDLLDSADGLREWLALRELGGARVRIGASELERARHIREGIRALLVANNGGEPPDPAALLRLDEALIGAETSVRFSDGHPRLSPVAGGFDGAMAAIAAEIVHAVADGRWARLKACPGTNCQWAFYDRSKNQAATWCSMQVCGGRAKAAAYYRRRNPPI